MVRGFVERSEVVHTGQRFSMGGSRRDRLRPRDRSSLDSLLERNGFELPVPGFKSHLLRRSGAWSRKGPGSHSRVLTTDNGRFTVRRARLAPAMISTPGHRASRRRQREALPAWRDFLESRLGLPPIKPVYDAAFGSMHTSPRDRGAGCNTRSRSQCGVARLRALQGTIGRLKSIRSRPFGLRGGNGSSSNPFPSSGESLANLAARYC